MIKHFSLDRCILLLNDTIHRKWVSTESFAMYKNDKNHPLWPQQSPNLNPIKLLWATVGMLDSTLHHHHQNTNLSWENGVSILHSSIVLLLTFSQAFVFTVLLRHTSKKKKKKPHAKIKHFGCPYTLRGQIISSLFKLI